MSTINPAALNPSTASTLTGGSDQKIADGLQEAGLRDLGDLTKQKAAVDEQSQFMQLFIAQLKNQNPLEPKDNGDFLAQLAQFSTVEGVKNLEKTVGDALGGLQTSNALQASSLVGKSVHLPANQSELKHGKGIEGAVNLDQAVGDLSLEIYGSNDTLVKSIPLGKNPAGHVDFKWDGTTSDGEAAPEGTYSVKAVATVHNTKVNFNTLIATNVNSVTIGAGGVGTQVNTELFGQVALADIRTIK